MNETCQLAQIANHMGRFKPISNEFAIVLYLYTSSSRKIVRHQRKVSENKPVAKFQANSWTGFGHGFEITLNMPSEMDFLCKLTEFRVHSKCQDDQISLLPHIWSEYWKKSKLKHSVWWRSSLGTYICVWVEQKKIAFQIWTEAFYWFALHCSGDRQSWLHHKNLTPDFSSRKFVHCIWSRVLILPRSRRWFVVVRFHRIWHSPDPGSYSVIHNGWNGIFVTIIILNNWVSFGLTCSTGIWMKVTTAPMPDFGYCSVNLTSCGVPHCWLAAPVATKWSPKFRVLSFTLQF